MRYTDIDLQSLDLRWFGIDRSGWIAAFTSGGWALVPEFVCRDREENEWLEAFFMERLEPFTSCRLRAEEPDNDLTRECRLLSEKGLYCFDLSDEPGVEYRSFSSPQTPLLFGQLPTEAAARLNTHSMDIDFADTTAIPTAYLETL